MGFFSDNKIGGLPGLSFISSAERHFADPFGAKAEAQAARRAGTLEEQIAREALEFRKQIFGEAAPFRERAGVAGEALLAEAQAPLGEDPSFQRDIREALVQQRLSFGAFGLGDSTTFGTAAGRTTADIASAARRRKTGILQFLAGGAEIGTAGALQAQGFATQAGLAQAQSILAAGQAKGAGRRATTQAGLDLLGTVGSLAALA